MNCGEAVKPRQYTVEAARKQVLNRNSAHSEWETWLSALIRANPWRKDPQKTNAAPDQPSGAASFVDPRLAFPPLGAASRRYWSDSAHQECHFYQYWPQSRDSENHFPATPAVASGPTRSKSGKWRRPQCPGNRYALTRASECPLAIHPRELPVCHQRHRNHSFGKFLRIATYSVDPLCGRLSQPATEKPLPLVQKLWMIVLPCGKLRKTKDELPSTRVPLHY